MTSAPASTDPVCPVCGETREDHCMLPRRMRETCGLKALRLAAWEEFVDRAYADPETLAAFHRATGRVIGTLRLDHVGPSTSRERLENVHAFIDWVTETRWGIERAPAEIKARICGRRRA